MSTSTRHRIWNTVAVLALLAGAGMSVRSARRFPTHYRHLATKLMALNELRTMENDLGDDRAAIDAFNALTTTRPAALSEMAKEALPGVVPDLRERDMRKLASGWSAREVEVIVSEFELEQLTAFVKRAEESRPPWRLVECGIVASGSRPGLGRATLVMEALQK